MKQRISLRMLLALSIMVSGTLIIVTFSLLSAKYFVAGMDVSMRESMKSFFELEAPTKGQPIQLNEFTIASHWEDLPSDLRFHLDPLKASNQSFIQKVIQPNFFSQPEAAYFAMISQVDGEQRFVSVTLSTPEAVMTEPGARYFRVIFYTCVGGLFVFSILLIILLRRIMSPLRYMSNWAQGLSSKNLSEAIPDFGFSDLNNMAKIIKNSVTSVEKSLQRERQFLSYASHELRTPISVTKSNVTLLKRLIEEDKSRKQQLEVTSRIERAANTMTQLTETLLWIGRKEDRETETNLINIGSLIKHVSDDLRYLVDSKEVSVVIDVDDESINLPETLCTIVISNLIRNAFQHTYCGQVEVSQKGGIVTILNVNTESTGHQPDLGFGIGLSLTEQLVTRYGWHYDVRELDNGRCVTLSFN
ncbi:HAMP domain-containing histidine kinase [Alteromonas sp. 5E99-2]|uniref:sensor histidine kinase n=1 Tax=Alteromonas sp. 5E99-2 TaxID=2817683 RepID=UPI001A99CAB0|nr:HAMP domain-containing sensor histidine kinase [Alteromonas sp. 5E99-2]MBO1256674.1 HAMP domain-containing histidine kinase [Alteromonas sp. 5E99-2]